jgi:HSP20 family molecular chaperone IbpA
MIPARRNNFGLSLFEDSLFKDVFASPLTNYNQQNWMPTDILEKNDHIVIEIEMPGFKKDDITVSVENGYLTVDAKVQSNTDETDTKGIYYRKERRNVTELSRTFYIGEVKEDEITAAYVNGILILSYPNSQYKQPPEKKKNIQIS